MMVIDGDYMISNHVDLSKESIEQLCKQNLVKHDGHEYVRVSVLAAIIFSYKAQIDERERELGRLKAELKTTQQWAIESKRRIAELVDLLDAWIMGE